MRMGSIRGSWRWLVAAGAVFVPATVMGALTIPHSFTANTPIKAAEVNANFDAIKTEVDAMSTRVDGIDSRATGTRTELEEAIANKQDKPARGTFVASSAGKAAYAFGSCSTGTCQGTLTAFNPTGETVTVTRNSTGDYKVTFPKLGASCSTVPCFVITGVPVVSAVGENSNICKVKNWGGINDVVVDVRCQTPAGAATDSNFSVMYMQ